MEVSAWTTPTALTWPWADKACATISGRTGLPHGTSRRCTSAPHREAISTMRSPKKPLTTMTTRSPGSTTLQNAASMPAVPVAGSGSVQVGLVPSTRRNMSRTWSNTGQKSGSRWPSSGDSIACKTRGCTLLGPARARSGSAVSIRCDNHSYADLPSDDRVAVVRSRLWLTRVDYSGWNCKDRECIQGHAVFDGAIAGHNSRAIQPV